MPQQKVSHLDVEKEALIQVNKDCELENNTSVIQPRINFNYTLGVLKNLRQYVLEKREKYLDSLVKIQSCLLSFEEPEYIFNQVLKIIGQCSGAAKVYLWENYFDSEGAILASKKFQWCDENNQTLNHNSNWKTLNYKKTVPRWLKLLSQGEIIAEEVTKLPEEEKQLFPEQNVVKILLLPLIINQEFYGFLGLENHEKNPHWEMAEIALLQSIVGAISLAWQRQQDRIKLEQLNQELEQRVKERTRELEEKNRELEQEINQHQQTTAALQKAKEQLEAVLDAVPASISWISSDLRYLGVNKQLAALLNLSQEELINKSVGSPKSHHEFLNYLNNFFKSNLDKSSAEFNLKGLHGESTYLMVAKKYDRGSAAILVGVDITERKKIEEEIYKSLLKEKELNQLKSNFITMTSHEFRTPLSTILGSVELLEHYSDRWNNQKKQKYLTRIYSTVQHITNMLDDMLLIGKSESDGFYFEPIPIQLSQFCSSLVQEFNLGENHRVIFKIESKSNQLKTDNYLLDPKLLRHILTNLISNALKYSSGIVDFDLIYDRYEATFSIRDKGIGILPEDQKHIFESFHRGQNVDKIPGTGLGLAIVKKAVELHGGKIRLESKLNHGTTITFTVPLNYF